MVPTNPAASHEKVKKMKGKNQKKKKPTNQEKEVVS